MKKYFSNALFLTNFFKTQGIRTVIAAVFLMLSGQAWSACTVEGKVARLRSGSVGNFVDITLRPIIPQEFVFFGVPSDRFYSMLGDAAAGNLTVILTGNASACPPPSLFRDGGVLTGVDMHTRR